MSVALVTTEIRTHDDDTTTTTIHQHHYGHKAVTEDQSEPAASAASSTTILYGPLTFSQFEMNGQNISDAFSIIRSCFLVVRTKLSSLISYSSLCHTCSETARSHGVSPSKRRYDSLRTYLHLSFTMQRSLDTCFLDARVYSTIMALSRLRTIHFTWARHLDFASLHRHVAKLQSVSRRATQLRHMTVPPRQPISALYACASN